MTDTSLTQQNDWMTEFVASHPHVGRLMWFTVDDGPVDRAQWLNAIMQAGLATYGLPDGIPASTAYLRGLRILQQATPQRTLLRRVERERGRTVHHWIEETVAGGQVHFRVLAAIERIAKAPNAAVLSVHRQTGLDPGEEAALARLTEFVQAAERTYTPGDRRRQVRRWLAGVGALPVASAGPVQFVPDEATGLIDSLASAQDLLGVRVWSMPLQRSGDVIATLTQSLDAEITQKTAALLKTVHDAKKAGTPPTTGQQAKLVEQLRDLSARVQRYEGLFGEQLTNLADQIAIAKQAVRQALAE